jgi:hypothetical protein
MLTSFATATSSTPSSPYESPRSWWKFNFTTNSYAAIAATFFPSSSSTQELPTSNTVEKRTSNIDHSHECE